MTRPAIVEVDSLPKATTSTGRLCTRGYLVTLDDEPFFFEALEPAYAFGRAGRMSAQVHSWGLNPAAFESRFDRDLGGDVRTFYVLGGQNTRMEIFPEQDRATLTAFANGADPSSSHWVPRKR